MASTSVSQKSLWRWQGMFISLASSCMPRLAAPLGSAATAHHRLFSGTASLDENGTTKVRLEKADALEPAAPLEMYDVSYSLTAVGASMPHLHIASELAIDGKALLFTIGGGTPFKKASWQIGLVRNT